MNLHANPTAVIRLVIAAAFTVLTAMSAFQHDSGGTFLFGICTVVTLLFVGDDNRRRPA